MMIRKASAKFIVQMTIILTKNSIFTIGNHAAIKPIVTLNNNFYPSYQ